MGPCSNEASDLLCATWFLCYTQLTLYPYPPQVALLHGLLLTASPFASPLAFCPTNSGTLLNWNRRTDILFLASCSARACVRGCSPLFITKSNRFGRSSFVIIVGQPGMFDCFSQRPIRSFAARPQLRYDSSKRIDGVNISVWTLFSICARGARIPASRSGSERDQISTQSQCLHSLQEPNIGDLPNSKHEAEAICGPYSPSSLDIGSGATELPNKYLLLVR